MKCNMKIFVLLFCACICICLFFCAGCGEKKGTGDRNNIDNKDNSSNTQNNQNGEAENKDMLEYINKEPVSLWDSVEQIPYYDASVTNQTVPELTPYVISTSDTSNDTKPCVIICPGGSYMEHAIDAEGYQIAEALNSQGISAFVLKYRVAPYDHKAILSDVFRAIRFVRYYSEDFGIDSDKIAIMGFSAGGHLASMALQNEPEIYVDEIDNVSAKLDCGVLCYAVLTMKQPYTHQTTRQNFLGEIVPEYYNEMIEKYSAELNVTDNMPPCFIWTCKPDTVVSFKNSEKLATAMDNAGVNCEFRLYEYGNEIFGGGHGIGLAKNCGDADGWFNACVNWLEARWY